MHQKFFSLTKRMLVHSSYLLIGSLLLLTTLFLRKDIRALIIPTKQATHTATLYKVVLGASGDQQVIMFDDTGGRAIISGGLVIGEIGGTSGNQIAREAINALIAGGSRNTINSAGINASISSFFA